VAGGSSSISEKLKLSPTIWTWSGLFTPIHSPAFGGDRHVEALGGAGFKGRAPLTCKTDKIDARVLAELSWRDLVPAVWLPDPTIRR
jgi:hypothetical protein